MQIPVERINRLLNQFLCIKIYHIDGFGTNSLPQGLEFRHRQLVVIHLQLYILVMGIFRLRLLLQLRKSCVHPDF